MSKVVDINMAPMTSPYNKRTVTKHWPTIIIFEPEYIIGSNIWFAVSHGYTIMQFVGERPSGSVNPYIGANTIYHESIFDKSMLGNDNMDLYYSYWIGKKAFQDWIYGADYWKVEVVDIGKDNPALDHFWDQKEKYYEHPYLFPLGIDVDKE